MKPEISVFSQIPSQKVSSPSIVIGTHSGIFHQDEVIAISLMCILHNDKNTIWIVRSRDINELNKCDVLVDIGNGKFDHHQIGGNGKRNNGIPYSSAGLVWKSFGKEIIHTLAKTNPTISANNTEIDIIFEKIDKEIVQTIDCIDNGIPTASTVFDYINSFLPIWTGETVASECYNKAFNEVINVTIEILVKIIIKTIEEYFTFAYISNQHSLTNSRILEIPAQSYPWLNAVLEINATVNIKIDFVIFKYPSGGWAAQSVPPDADHKFDKRIPFPKSWAGHTTKLPEISGVEDATFCHNNLFFIRAKSYESIIKMCEIAIDVANNI